MTIQPIAPTVSLLYLARAELQERGLHPTFLTREHTLTLAREGLSYLGQPAGDILELESYPDKAGLLLFIHTAPAAPAVWRFFSGDALLDAVAALHGLDPRPMYWWQDAFWLVGQSGAALSEFADPVRDDPFLSARLAEYGQPLS